LKSKNICIGLDAFGGDPDKVPQNPIEGAILASQMDPSITIKLIGDRERIIRELKLLGDSNQREIIHAPIALKMGTGIREALRQKDSSVYVGLKALQEGKIDAFLSGGDTGAVTAISRHLLNTIPGVYMPAISTIFPTLTGPCVFLDVGATLYCDSSNLVQFAMMGWTYSKFVLNVSDPKVALLNVGKELAKGDREAKEANRLLTKCCENKLLNYIGFIEGDDILPGKAQVVVSEGKTANVILKFAGNVVLTLLLSVAKDVRDGTIDQKFFAWVAKHLMKWLLSPTIGLTKMRFNYESYGGAPLLGIPFPVIIAHGKSSPRAFSIAIKKAVESVQQNVNQKIADQIDLTNKLFYQH